MRVGTILFFLFISNTLFGQTENHKAIPGTKYSLIPPGDFVPATNFRGFQKSDLRASIMVHEVTESLQSMLTKFTKEALKSQGMILLDKQTVDFNKSKATIIKISQPANGIIYLKQLLIFGDSKKTVLVSGIYLEAVREIEGDIKTSLLSITFNKDQSDSPFEAVKFTIEVDASVFKFAKLIAASMYYTTDRQFPTKAPDKALLEVASSFSKVRVVDKKQYAVDRLKGVPRGKSRVVKEIKPITIDRLEGFEIVADGQDATGKKQLVYQVILFIKEEGYYLIVGTTTAKFDSYLASFRSIAGTFKQKD